MYRARKAARTLVTQPPLLKSKDTLATCASHLDRETGINRDQIGRERERELPRRREGHEMEDRADGERDLEDARDARLQRVQQIGRR